MSDDHIQTVYDMLWDTSFEAISRGDIDIDPYITNPGLDRRRGLTLIFRPPEEIKTTVIDFLKSIQVLEPDQYYYGQSNLHFTVLSLFTAIPDYQEQYNQLDRYRKVVVEVIDGVSPFSLHLRGLTVSRGALMVCGYPDSDTLNNLRNALRQKLIQNNLAQGLDKRYTLTAAHSTVMRFSHPLRNPFELSQIIQTNRYREFGRFDVKCLQLVKNDWYMSQQHTPIMAEYYLRQA